ncbi:MAG TPA: DUF6152 family protein [Vicinamibacterales bacterium]
MNTRRTARSVALAAALLLSAAPLATAHHGTNISYDRSKQFTAQAVVTEFQYRNPHPELHVELKDDKGAVVKWSLELLPNPAQLIRTGWSRAKANEALKPGTQVMVTVAPSKAGGVVGLLLRVTSLSGEELVTGGGGPGGRQGDPEAGRQGGTGRGN